MNIEQFNPTVAELTKLATEAKNITKESGLDIVKSTRIQLRDTRVSITKKGKELREEALAFQKAVISKEKELVEIITPEEDRLQEIEDKVKEEKLRLERLEKLPERKEKLLTIDGSMWATDEKLLEMDGVQFGIFYNNCVSEVFEKAQTKLREEQQKLDEEKNKLVREQQIKEAEERGKIQAQKDLEQKEMLEKLEKEATERKIAEIKIAEAKKLADSVRYQDFLKKCGVDNSDTFEIKDNGKEVRVYKLIDIYTK